MSGSLGHVDAHACAVRETLGRARAGGLDLGTLLEDCRLQAWKDGIGKMQVQYLMTEVRARKYMRQRLHFPKKR